MPPGIKAAEVAADKAYQDCIKGGKTRDECDKTASEAYEAELKA